MSDYAYIAKRARMLFARVARLEAELARNPNDWAVLRNLKSVKKIAVQAQLQLESLSAQNQVEVCDYRFVPKTIQCYSLAGVAKCLLEYQNLFSQLYDSKKNGKKNKAALSESVQIESALEFGFSYSGSLGVVLLANGERSFFEGRLDSTIESFYQILNISSLDDVRDISASLGRAVVKRIHDWSKANVDAGFSADIRWKQSDGRIREHFIDRSQLEIILKYIGSASEKKVETRELVGMLVGADMHSRTFHIADQESHKGSISKTAIIPNHPMLGKNYRAEIEVTEEYFYATDTTISSISLHSLTGPIEPASN